MFITLDTLQKKKNSIYLLKTTVYLLAHEIDGFIEEKEGIKYLNITLTDSNSKVSKKYAEIWSGIKDWIEKINGSKSGEHGKDYMKSKFNSDNDLPLNKQLV